MANNPMMEFGQSFIERFGKNYKTGEIVFCEYEPGDSFYFLLKGRVKITKISSDTEKILDILEPTSNRSWRIWPRPRRRNRPRW